MHNNRTLPHQTLLKTFALPLKVLLLVFFLLPLTAEAHTANYNNPGHLKHGVNYAYFEGDWQTLPDFDELATTVSGKTNDIDLDVRYREEYFGLQFTGYINIKHAGNYTFYLRSDDGSRFTIDETVVVDNDGYMAHKP